MEFRSCHVCELPSIGNNLDICTYYVIISTRSIFTLRDISLWKFRAMWGGLLFPSWKIMYLGNDNL